MAGPAIVELLKKLSQVAEHCMVGPLSRVWTVLDSGPNMVGHFLTARPLFGDSDNPLIHSLNEACSRKSAIIKQKSLPFRRLSVIRNLRIRMR